MSYKSQVKALHMSSKANNNGKLYPEVGNVAREMRDSDLTTGGYITTEHNSCLLAFNAFNVLARIPMPFSQADTHHPPD